LKRPPRRGWGCDYSLCLGLFTCITIRPQNLELFLWEAFEVLLAKDVSNRVGQLRIGFLRLKDPLNYKYQGWPSLNSISSSSRMTTSS
jgi:hypothetical protein